MTSRIAVVVPTIRPERYKEFFKTWMPLFLKHDVYRVTVWDGDTPYVRCGDTKMTPKQLLGKDADLILDHTASCRNLGFAYVAKYLPRVDTLITLDDDLTPIGDPIQDHLDILGTRVPVSWMSTVDGVYPRGMPYGVREEARVILSHGVWEGTLDLDAVTQMTLPKDTVYSFRQGIIPKGVLAPLSSMNLAFSRTALPFIFHAPMNMERWGMDRFDDIWGLLDAKRELDKAGFAAVTGYSRVYHTRASDPFVNLIKEARGLKLNETFWQGVEDDPYFTWYRDARSRWKAWLAKL